jgi:hypothetical protein
VTSSVWGRHEHAVRPCESYAAVASSCQQQADQVHRLWRAHLHITATRKVCRRGNRGGAPVVRPLYAGASNQTTRGTLMERRNGANIIAGQSTAALQESSANGGTVVISFKPGPMCGSCRTDEAGCAREYPCCGTCTHTFGGYDPAVSNLKRTGRPPSFRKCTTCGSTYGRRYVLPHCMTCGGEVVVNK